MIPVRPTQTTAAIRMLLLLTVVLGLAYPFAVTGVAQVAFPDRADGSLVEVDGSVVGSELVGQPFEDSAGLFAARPSALDPEALEAGPVSGASNEGPESETLADVVRERRAEVAEREGVAPGPCPSTRSRPAPAASTPTSARRTPRSRWPGWRARTTCPPTPYDDWWPTPPRAARSGCSGRTRVNVLLLNVAVTEAAEDAGRRQQGRLRP